MSLKIILTLGCMISFTVVANLILKQGAMVPASERVFLGIFGWKSMVGFLAFACAGLIYAVVLRWLPLNVAQSVASIQFVAVILASAVILSEPIPLVRWLGIALIAAGVLLVGSTVDSNAAGQRKIDSGAQTDG
jgi:undecaprenyl phosphate-alpha-L-ara4N flippase subunit ArnE